MMRQVLVRILTLLDIAYRSNQSVVIDYRMHFVTKLFYLFLSNSKDYGHGNRLLQPQISCETMN